MFKQILFFSKMMSPFVLLKKLYVPSICIYTHRILTPSTISAEHVVPQSFLKTSKSKRDLHNVYLADIVVNKKRSNLVYGDPVDDEFHFVDGKFVPPVSTAGAIARSVLYMLDRYEVKRLPCTLNLLEDMATLPVENWEVQHNKIVYRIQGAYNHRVKSRKSLYLRF
jgi:endonuclease I